MSRTWAEVKKELFTPEEIQEAKFKAALMDAFLKASKDMGISQKRLVELGLEFFEDDIVEEDDLQAIEEGEKEYAAGETISLDDFEKGIVTA